LADQAPRRADRAHRPGDRRRRPQRVAAVDSADREEIDLIAGRRDQLGLDPLTRAEERDLCALSAKLVGDRYGRHDVAGGPPGRYDDSWLRQIGSFRV
jgi:hypothetical protein